jgi:catechol 2,3-dioxygenase-like lactoylglutathione lyase family enzyme
MDLLGFAPILPSADFERTIAFYRRLGFHVEVRYGDDYLIVMRDDVGIHFTPDAVDPLMNTHACFLYVTDADVLHGEWTASGIEPDAASGSRLTDVETAPYGLREFAVIDLDGNLVRVGSPLGAA